MGSNDGGETCKLVGLFLLYSIGEKLNKDNMGLYRDDGLTCFKNNYGHQNDKIRKELIKIFQAHGLKLEIKCNLKSVENAKSNHPLSILKQIPAAISKGISINSSNKKIFQKAALYYNNILKDSGYEEKIQFQQYEHQQKQPGRS